MTQHWKTEHWKHDADPTGQAGHDDPDQTDRKRQALFERKKRFDDALDRGLEDSFPGSDPVAVTQPPRSVRDRYRP